MFPPKGRTSRYEWSGVNGRLAARDCGKREAEETRHLSFAFTVSSNMSCPVLQVVVCLIVIFMGAALCCVCLVLCMYVV